MQVHAPYITAWGAEQDLPCTLVERPDGSIGYANELLSDRDRHGVSWRQTSLRHGVGRPEFARVHPLRQRRAMELLLCQVCGGPADQTDDGVLWLQRDHRDDWPRWPEGMASVEPPICLSCVPVARRMCPALRRRCSRQGVSGSRCARRALPAERAGADSRHSGELRLRRPRGSAGSRLCTDPGVA